MKLRDRNATFGLDQLTRRDRTTARTGVAGQPFFQLSVTRRDRGDAGRSG